MSRLAAASTIPVTNAAKQENTRRSCRILIMAASPAPTLAVGPSGMANSRLYKIAHPRNLLVLSCTGSRRGFRSTAEGSLAPRFAVLLERRGRPDQAAFIASIFGISRDPASDRGGARLIPLARIRGDFARSRGRAGTTLRRDGLRGGRERSFSSGSVALPRRRVFFSLASLSRRRSQSPPPACLLISNVLEDTMSKTITAIVATASIAAAALATPKPAEARCLGCWIGAGIAAGVIGGALASQAYGYGYPAYGYGYGYPAYGYGYPAYGYSYGYSAYGYGYPAYGYASAPAYYGYAPRRYYARRHYYRY
jgi:hypothetical protein